MNVFISGAAGGLGTGEAAEWCPGGDTGSF